MTYPTKDLLTVNELFSQCTFATVDYCQIFIPLRNHKYLHLFEFLDGTARKRRNSDNSWWHQKNENKQSFWSFFGVNHDFYSHANKNYICRNITVHSSNFYILHNDKTPELLDEGLAHAYQWMCEYNWNDPVKKSYPLCI